ncbi:MAG: hypothetical protein IKF52_03025 [Clostridia bacterium]|nr:hypothetical protein [Clostridia bacterium]
MYYNSYDDYMRGSCGCGCDGLNNGFGNYTYPMYNDYNFNRDVDCEAMYPDIYHRINPIIESHCIKYQNTRITKEVIEEIANKVYIKYYESRSNDDLKSDSNRLSSSSNSSKKEETRSNRNDTLMDLIKILIIRNLFPNRPNRPGRPPMRPNPGMPPYPNWQDGPGGPNMPPQYGPMFY